ncbi:MULTISPECIES: hypothetical protein [Paraburkholderia]|jgi:hypothetical protein|uniref:hypothetical protein n=1 Tax=Paraburkholderia TaxID=1822464 RepID=UPI0015DAE94E|nr:MULTISPECIES: hypothetical protein [Paraburkholderia]BEU23081.1 hypothetical protein PBP221_32210 [Paraburkholderia sp. 22B1P]GJH35245.1 hypothetical protein CBA19CS91_20830 [Paraburkholderia hospita]CAG9244826.1 conserved hypothetical protein [Paraburkholderia caribensis]
MSTPVLDEAIGAQRGERPPCCADCRFRADDRHSLEQSIPGLAVFGSGFGASVADSRLCLIHDQLVAPRDSCSQFSRMR